MNKPDTMTGPIGPCRTEVALAAAGLASTRALTRLAGVLGLVLLFDPAALAQTVPVVPVLPVRAPTGLLNGVQAPVTNGAGMTIKQDNQRAIIDWQSFNIGPGNSVTVTQPAATSVLLNRVVAGSATNGPSTINGALQANGRIFILDPNGVVLGSTAQVNVGGLLAAAMTMTSTDADFVSGVGLTLARSTNGQGTVQVDFGAQIAGGSTGVTVPTGDVVLLGANNVDLNGTIVASNVFVGAGGGAQVPVGDSGFVKLSLLPATSTGANFVSPTVTAGAFGVIDAKGGSVTIATSGDGERAITWASAIDAAGGSINFSGAALTGTAVNILSQSDTATPIPVPLAASSITIDGRSDVGTGVSLANVNFAGDNIAVRGVAAPTGVAVPQSNGLPTIGVDVTAVQVNLGASGTLRVAGLADAGSGGSAFGLRLNGLTVTTPDAGGTRVTLAGQGLNGATNAGIVTNNGGGSGMFRLSGVQLPSGAEVVMGASAAQNGQAFQSLSAAGGLLGLPSAPAIDTTGRINLRPLGVDLNGSLVEQLTQPIQIESRPAQVFTTPFVVPANWLADVNLDGGGNIAAAAMVIGSAQHQGKITLGANALQSDTLPLTLQNQGSGSGGVTLQGNASTARELTIMSAGPVDQSGPLRVERLLLQGNFANTMTLNDPGNEVASLGVSRVGKLDLVANQLVSGAPIAVSPDTGPLIGFDADLDVFTSFTITADLPRAPLDMSMSQLLSSTSSDTYGRNLASPSMCLAPGAARRDRAVGDGVDLLGLEWGRVRLQPQLSSCVEIATDQSCSAF